MFRLCCFLFFAVLSSLAAGAEILIGQVAPLTGNLAPTGLAYRAGVQLYFDTVNAEGGIHGARLRLVSKDDEYRSELTVRQTRELLKESNPLALIGYVGSASVKALLDERLLEREGLPLIGIRTGASAFYSGDYPWLFVTRASYAEEIARILEVYAVMGNTRFGVFYQNDGFGLDGLATIEQLLPKLKGQIVARGSYEKNTADVAAAVKAIQAAAPQVVLLISNTAATAEFVRQLRTAGNLSMLVGLSSSDGPQIVGLIGAERAKGLALSQIVPAPNNLNFPLIREVQAAYKRFPPPDMRLNHALVEGYLAARILGEALRKCGPNPGRSQLREVLRGFQSRDFGGVSISLSGGAEAGTRFVDLNILDRNGNLLR